MRSLILAALMVCVLAAQAQYTGIGIVGDSADVNTPTRYGAVLMGGNTDVDEAFRWMIDRSGGGDFVIIRAGGSTGYNQYVYDFGGVNSVETLLINSRDKANLKTTGDRIRQAEALFIAGGDQGNYVNFWADTEVSRALDYLIHVKMVPVGGTSAGCAVMSEIVFDARQGTATSDELLNDPFHVHVSLSKSFLRIPGLEGTLTDQHYAQRSRQGRHVTLLARMINDFGIRNPRGIAVNEKTAVCIDEHGSMSVYGSSDAYFLEATTVPEKCEKGVPLSWDAGGKAIRVWKVAGSKTGTKAFTLPHWPAQTDTWWYVRNGQLGQMTR